MEQTWVQVHWYLYLSTISTALLSTCKVFKYFLLKVTCTCTCTESLSQVLNPLSAVMLTRDQTVSHEINLLKEEKKWTITFNQTFTAFVSACGARRGSFVIEDIPYCLVSLKRRLKSRTSKFLMCESIDGQVFFRLMYA